MTFGKMHFLSNKAGGISGSSVVGKKILLKDVILLCKITLFQHEFHGRMLKGLGLIFLVLHLLVI